MRRFISLMGILVFYSLSLLSLPNKAVATPLFYSDRASFEAALSSSALIDFENPVPPRTLGNTYTVGAATLVSTDGSGLFASGPDLQRDWGAPSHIIASENYGGLRVDLAPNFNALGMEIGELFNARIFEFTLKGTAGVLLDSGSLSVTQVTNFSELDTTFYGWISTTGDIESLEWQGPGFEAIDNVIYGNTRQLPSAPEPATMLLLGSGLVGLIGFRRKFRKS